MDSREGSSIFLVACTCGDRKVLGGFFGGDPVGNGFINAFFIVADELKYDASSSSFLALIWKSFVTLFATLGRLWESKRNAGDRRMLLYDELLELLNCL